MFILESGLVSKKVSDMDVRDIKTNTVMMPKELTAENGAKGLMSGEFSQKCPVICPDCSDTFDNEGCVTCGGDGELYQNINISWTNIKEIYAMAVKHLGH